MQWEIKEAKKEMLAWVKERLEKVQSLDNTYDMDNLWEDIRDEENSLSND